MIPRLGAAAANLAAWARDYVYAVRWQAAGVLGRWRPAHYRGPGEPGRTPVVLIPGIYESWTFMLPVAGLLREHGHDVHVVEDLRFNTGTIEDMAALVDEHIRREGIERCVLVAHSKGGLIGKQALLDDATRERVRRLVAVNSPYAGSRYAALFLLPTVRMFAPRGQVITDLQRQQAVNATITSLYSVFDPHIPETSWLGGAENVVLRTIGHFRPVGSAETLGIIDDVLRRVAR